MPPVEVALLAADPPAPDKVAIRFERPVLVTEIEVGGEPLTVVNVHFRAPIASAIPGQKTGPYSWKRVDAWAEGYYLSGLKRIGQALEVRRLVDQIFDADASAKILVTGDFNAEIHDTTMRLLKGGSEDTGNGDLADRSLVVLDSPSKPRAGSASSITAAPKCSTTC